MVDRQFGVSMFLILVRKRDLDIQPFSDLSFGKVNRFDSSPVTREESDMLFDLVSVSFVLATLYYWVCVIISISCKDGDDFLRQLQKLRCLFRAVQYYLWKKVTSQLSNNYLKILLLVLTLWIFGCGIHLVCLIGMFLLLWLRRKQSISVPSVLIFQQIRVSTTTPTSALTTPNSTRSAIFFACGVVRIPSYLVLNLVCKIIMLVTFVLVLIILGLVMKRKTVTSSRSPSSSAASTVNSSPKPSQPDTFRYRYLKTDSDFHCYLRHYGYLMRHFGYILVTSTTSWVVATLIALGNLNFKKSGSCFLHVPMNIGLDLIRSLPCNLTHTGSVFRISLALYVWSSPLRERRISETVFRSGGIDLIGKNWWRYYNMYDCMILKTTCKVSDYLNRLSQYMS